MPARLLTPIPLHRVATAMPFINYLHQTGAPVERELMRANLPVQAMEDPDCFIPSRNYWTFIANVVKRKGMEDLGFRVGQQVGANAADPGLAKRLTRLATLHRALDKFCKIASAEITQVDLWLGPADKNTHQLHYRTSYDREHPACVQFQWYGLMAAVAAIQLFAGKHWKPRQIGLATDEIPGNAIRAYFPNTRFLQGQSHCFIAMDNRLLGKPPLPHEDILQSLPRYSKIKPPRDFISTLKLALRSHLRDEAPSLDLAADIAGLSPRTLQRRLADEELTYRELLLVTRHETAIDLLENTEHTITEIATLLGYSDPSHFARAFQRRAGVSPREYLQ
jgi:AraC-like DNA-binding protein